MFPVLGQTIIFKEYDSEVWVKARVFGVFKKSSIYSKVKQMVLEDGMKVEKNFETDVEDWKPLTEEAYCDQSDTEWPETSFLSFILGKQGDEVCEVYPVEIIKKGEYGRADVQDAMQSEIEKYKTFDAFEEVDDEGQESVPIRWVVTKQGQDGKNQPIKARMCIRGDLEDGKDTVRSDSPTAAKESLKLALIVAANEGFKVNCGDIKSAYLQGLDLQRKIYVRPPPEAGNEEKLWLLKKAAYGVLDGGRSFYLRLVQELKQLGLHKVHADGALFTYVVDGKLHGLIASNVDDLILAGDEKFKTEVEEKLQGVFKFSKIEEKTFKYCGCNISVKTNGDIELDQNDYVDKLREIEKKEGDDDRPLVAEEVKELRGK